MFTSQSRATLQLENVPATIPPGATSSMNHKQFRTSNCISLSIDLATAVTKMKVAVDNAIIVLVGGYFCFPDLFIVRKQLPKSAPGRKADPDVDSRPVPTRSLMPGECMNINTIQDMVLIHVCMSQQGRQRQGIEQHQYQSDNHSGFFDFRSSNDYKSILFKR